MKFCPKCGSRMVLKKEGRKNLYVCPKCGYSEQA
ncbi:MAG: NADH pyrophosphatase zinc ribbon domain-containing protein, partial [Thermoproteota archaeon]